MCWCAVKKLLTHSPSRGVHILSLGGALTTYTPKLSPKIISRPGGGLALTASPWLRLCPARLLRLWWEWSLDDRCIIVDKHSYIHLYSPFLVDNWNIQKWTDRQRLDRQNIQNYSRKHIYVHTLHIYVQWPVHTSTSHNYSTLLKL